jgi:hypothetical protein
MSHTIPWSLERLAWAKAFTGTMDDVVKEFVERVEADGEWSVAEHTPKSVSATRAELLKQLKAPGGRRSIAAWTTWLNDAIERYVGAYQASPFAAYATEGSASGESTARSRGEAGNVKQMRAWEELLGRIKEEARAKEASKDEEELATVESESEEMPVESQPPDGGDVRAVAAQLVDVPELDSNRKSVELGTLKKRWIAELNEVFPLLVGAYHDDIAGAFDDEAKQSERAMALSKLVVEDGVQTRAKRTTEGSLKAIESVGTATATATKRRRRVKPKSTTKKKTD